MPRRLQDLAANLAKLSVQIKHDLEDAEAKVGQVNQLIAQLAQTGLLGNAVLLGKFRELPFDPDAGAPAPERVIQAALLAPEGLGICQWDSREAYRPDQEPEHFRRDARERFRPFADLDDTDQVFILPQIEALLEELVAIAQTLPASASAPPP